MKYKHTHVNFGYADASPIRRSAYISLPGASVPVEMKSGENNDSVLHIAASRGRTDILASLLCKLKTLNNIGGLVDAVNADGETALMVAVESGHSQSAAMLLAEGFSPNTRSHSVGKTVLHEAVSRGHSRSVYELLRRKDSCITLPVAALDFFRDHHTLPQPSSMEQGLKDYRSGVVKDEQLPSPPRPSIVGSRYCRGFNKLFLHYAVKWESACVIKDLLQSGDADIGAKDEFGRSALHMAALRGEAGVVAVLLESGASMDDREDLRGQTALQWAASQGYCDVVQEMVKHGASVDQLGEGQGRQTPLHVAVCGGHTGVVKVLLESGASIDLAQEKHGRTSLHLAAVWGLRDVFSVLLERGASVQEKDLEGCTAFETAVRNNEVDLVNTFLAHISRDKFVEGERVANVADHLKRKDRQGRTVLHEAILAGSRDMVSSPLRAGCEVDAEDSLGQSPLHLAVAPTVASSVAIVKELLHYGASSEHTRDNHGQTPFGEAVGHGDTNIVRAFCEHTPSVYGEEDRERVAALCTAVDAGHWEIVRLLLHNGVPFTQVLMEAVRSDSVQVVDMLLAGRAELTRGSLDFQGRSLLHIATEEKSTGEFDIRADNG